MCNAMKLTNVTLLIKVQTIILEENDLPKSLKKTSAAGIEILPEVSGSHGTNSSDL